VTVFYRSVLWPQKSTVTPTSESPFDSSGDVIVQFLRSLQCSLDPDNLHLAGRDLSSRFAVTSRSDQAALVAGNLADRVIKPVFKANGIEWKGWHAYRRGLATNLHELGVPDKVIQAILRHEDVSTTQRSYIKTVPRIVSDAMRQLEEKIARAADVQQVSVN
jgi:Phage integrase family